MTEIDKKTYVVDQALLEVPEIKEALSLAEESAYTPEELVAYDRNWDAIRTENTYVTDKMNEGLKKGREQGMEIGIKKGEIERQYKVAKKSLAKGWDIPTIAEITELSIEEIERIKAEVT